LHEIETGDINKINATYCIAHKEEAILEQAKKWNIPQSTTEKILKLERGEGIGKIAKDIDLVENAMTAKELVEKGILSAYRWIETIHNIVKHDFSREIVEEILRLNTTLWPTYYSLKKLPLKNKSESS
jgi:hypothetical protein